MWPCSGYVITNALTLGDVEINLQDNFSNTFRKLVSWALPVNGLRWVPEKPTYGKSTFDQLVAGFRYVQSVNLNVISMHILLISGNVAVNFGMWCLIVVMNSKLYLLPGIHAYWRETKMSFGMRLSQNIANKIAYAIPGIPRLPPCYFANSWY